tara:strand:- start:3560 stop:3718 length:159 start_codon:yes stop_codon:yes gene_type:complete
MRSLFFKCTECNIYTQKQICKNCNSKTINPLPPKYSPEDKYGKYRRKALQQK